MRLMFLEIFNVFFFFFFYRAILENYFFLKKDFCKCSFENVFFKEGFYKTAILRMYFEGAVFREQF